MDCDNRIGPFTATPLPQLIQVEKLVTLHYFSYTPQFRFTGEKHDFWEIAYADRGEAGVLAEADGYTLHQGEAIFHRPGEYHNIWANNQYANIVIVAFVCASPSMTFFERKILPFGAYQQALLAQILAAGESSFADPLDDVHQTAIRLRPEASPAGLQMMRGCLELLLVSLLQADEVNRQERLSPAVKQQGEVHIVRGIKAFLEGNLYASITFEDVLREVCFSKSYITRLFREQAGQSVMEYYQDRKIAEAKRLVSRGEQTVSQIAEELCYSSVHYFSRLFKKKTGMTPLEYRRSVRSRSIL